LDHLCLGEGYLLWSIGWQNKFAGFGPAPFNLRSTYAITLA
jgi:hypothetical protein